MTPEYINLIIAVIMSGGLAALITALSLGRKTRSETRLLDQQTAEGYQKLAADMEDRYTALLTRADDMRIEIGRLRETVTFLSAENADLRARLITVETELKKYTNGGAAAV